MTEAMLALLYVSKSFGSLVQFLVSHHKFRPLNFMLFFLCMYISRPFPDCSCSFVFSPLIFVFLSRPHSPPPFLLPEPLPLLLAPPLLQALFGSPCFALLLILLLKRLEIRETVPLISCARLKRWLRSSAGESASESGGLQAPGADLLTTK